MEKLSKSKREAREEKQRDQKLEEVVLKTLEDCSTPEDKLKLLLQRHVESEKNVNRLTNELRSHLREKEQVQRELNKSVLMRDKLQEVCREQQRIIKSVKNESMLQIKVEEERRKESQTKFQSSLNEITQSLTKNNEENMKLRDYNIEMTKKLKLLAEQYQTREKHLEKLNEQVKLETQLHQAKLNKAMVEAAMEKEILTKENQIGLEKLLQAQRAIKELTDREHQLKEQLNIYTAKYDEFQQSLQKSNDVFTSYKQELEKMSKYTKKIETEALQWRQRYEKSNAIVIELATEKQVRDQHAERCNKQVDQLQKLLRALQLERTALHKQLRDNNLEIPAMPTLPPEPEPMKIVPINSDKDKMELMTRNCAELKQTLANLQNQMKLLTTTESKAPASKSGASGSNAADSKANKEQPKPTTNAQKKNNNKKKAKSKAKAAAANALLTAEPQPVEDGSPPVADDLHNNEEEGEGQLSPNLPTEPVDDVALDVAAAGDAIQDNGEKETVPVVAVADSKDNMPESLEAAGDADVAAIAEKVPIDLSEVPALIDAD
ncbi:alpha-taxilin [Scaptodrosophila lebanonensis]|uniref:Alpha-taxilin n=1 Tax=Drosophila lebanonensis TaxID=7225 RepID=A0A6J2TGB3_DROLE|nr:alpha-taxilin [Scaptodrosophila lebanonensis]